MPGWHKKTTELRATGKLRMLGISEEQHGDRTTLFMQWQQMQWPVLIDSLNLLEVKAVPITLLIDQSGVIRYKNPKQADLDTFLATEYPSRPVEEPVTWKQELARAAAVVNSANLSGITEAVGAFDRIADKSPRQWFHYGVLRRKRFDSPSAGTDDFAEAVIAWSKALDGDPSQYIWRRRIQQYGPRLDKPYPFYDWVPKAREAIAARGETPVPLIAEPSGAEFAVPGKVTSATASEQAHPDPDNKVPEDHKGLVTVTSVSVPSTDAQKPGWRAHLTFQPNPVVDAHWNNETGPMVVWLNTPDAVGTQHFEVATDGKNLTSATSNEPRHLEFEIVPSDKKSSPPEVSGIAYIYICESATGTCMYLRKAFTVKIPSAIE